MLGDLVLLGEAAAVQEELLGGRIGVDLVVVVGLGVGCGAKGVVVVLIAGLDLVVGAIVVVCRGSGALAGLPAGAGGLGSAGPLSLAGLLLVLGVEGVDVVVDGLGGALA